MERTNVGELSEGMVEGLRVAATVAEAIRELREVPSGHLYASVMGLMSLETYEKVIGMLKNAGLVEESPNHLLRWVRA